MARSLLHTTALTFALAATVSLGSWDLRAQSIDSALPDGGSVSVNIGDSSVSIGVNAPSIGFSFSDSFSFGSGGSGSGTGGVDGFATEGASSPLGGKAKGRKALPLKGLSSGSRTAARAGGAESASRDLAASIIGGTDSGLITAPLLGGPPLAPALATETSTGPAVNVISGAGTTAVGGGKGVLNPANEGSLTRGIVKDSDGNIIAYKGRTYSTHPYSQEMARMAIKLDSINALIAGQAAAANAREFEAISREAGALSTAFVVIPSLLSGGTAIVAALTGTTAIGGAAFILGGLKGLSLSITANNAYLAAKTEGADEGTAAGKGVLAAGHKALLDVIPAGDDIFSVGKEAWAAITQEPPQGETLGDVFYGRPSEPLDAGGAG